MEEENKFECPICLTAKEFFNGNRYIKCNTCDDEGLVNEEINNIYTSNDDDLI